MASEYAQPGRFIPDLHHSGVAGTVHDMIIKTNYSRDSKGAYIINSGNQCEFIP